VHAPTRDKCDDKKDSFYQEIERVFDKFHRCHMKILFGDFSAKVDRKGIFKSTIGNKSLHETSNDNEVRVTQFATSKIELSRVQCSYIAKFINAFGLLLVEKRSD
jgi:hypothetical protein